MSPQAPLVLAVAIVGFCWFFRGWLESDPVTHVLIQLPLLAFAGALVAHALKSLMHRSHRLHEIRNQAALPLILVAIFTTAFWMLPRSIDAALVDPLMELAKFVTVPGMIGAPLWVGWRRAHPLLRGFLKAQTVSMLAVMAFLYTHAPIRICNAYLVADQERLGFGFLFAAIICAILWTVPIFLEQKQDQPGDERATAS